MDNIDLRVREVDGRFFIEYAVPCDEGPAWRRCDPLHEGYADLWMAEDMLDGIAANCRRPGITWHPFDNS